MQLSHQPIVGWGSQHPVTLLQEDALVKREREKETKKEEKGRQNKKQEKGGGEDEKKMSVKVLRCKELSYG
jgi:hypothetical protein